MTKMLSPNQWEKAKNGFWLLKNGDKSFFFFCLFLFFAPTQFGYHFWFPFSFIHGIRIDYLSPTIYLTDILILILILITCFLFLLNKKRFASSIQIFIRHKTLISCLCIYALLNSAFSLSPVISLYGYLRIVELGVLIYLIQNYFRISSKYQQAIYYAFILGVFFQSLLGVAQFFFQHSLGGVWYFIGERTFSTTTPGIANMSIFGNMYLRPYGTLPHPNVLAAYLYFAIILLIAKTEKSFINTCVVIWLIGVLLLTDSRTIFIVIGITGSSYLLNKILKVKFQKILVTVLLSTSFLLIVIALYLHGFINVGDESISQREQLYLVSAKIISGHILTGVGQGAFIAGLSAFPTNLYQPVHNVYVLFIVEHGLIGFIGLLTLFFKYYQRLKQLINNNKTLFFSIVLIGLNDHYFLTLSQGISLLAIVVGIMLSTKHSPFTSRSENITRIR